MTATTSQSTRPQTARELMSREVLTVRDDLTLQELATFLVNHEIGGAPVTDETDKLVGMVSVADVARAASDEAGMDSDRSNPEIYVRGWENKFTEEEIRSFHVAQADLLVRDIMSPAVFSVGEEATVSDVATAMKSGHLHRLVVTDADGKVTGIVTASDLLGLLIEG